MKREQPRMNLPALGMATAMALAVTLGVPAAMQIGGPAAPHDMLATQASRDGAIAVAIQPQRIDVIAVRERATNGHRWLSFANLRHAG
jgi:hypothetical protein